MLFVEPYFGEKSLKGYLSCFSPHYHPPYMDFPLMPFQKPHQQKNRPGDRSGLC